ncbi:MAG: hypothetical protein JSR58_01625 [Verrucomicrobia bacterium]|nr:hypothetical protein [Verrucomicrobiota bacterium]
MNVGIHREGSTLYIATVDKGRLLETKTCSIEDVHPNNLKIGELGKEGPQNFHSEQATIAERQGASEKENFEVKPTLPKTKFSNCLGVKPFDSPITTGLSFDQVLRREVSFKLKRRSQVLAAIPFQAESLIPYPLTEAILYPEFLPTKTGTDVVLLATKNKFLESHIVQFGEIGIDPVQVASLPTALVAWARFTHPEKTDVALFYDRSCVVCLKGKIVFSQSFEEKDRLKAFLQAKFPEAEPIQADGMALAIGLALDKVQWRTGALVSETAKKIKRKETNRFIAAALLCAAATLGLGEGILAYHRHGLEKRLGGGPLQEKITTALQEIQEKKKELPLAPPSHLVSDILAYLGAKSPEVDIMSVRYTSHGLGVKIEIKFLAPTPTIAKNFRQQIAETTRKEITLTPEQDEYKMAFTL